jgi:hypothetical protein
VNKFEPNGSTRDNLNRMAKETIAAVAGTGCFAIGFTDLLLSDNVTFFSLFFIILGACFYIYDFNVFPIHKGIKVLRFKYWTGSPFPTSVNRQTAISLLFLLGLSSYSVINFYNDRSNRSSWLIKGERLEGIIVDQKWSGRLRFCNITVNFKAKGIVQTNYFTIRDSQCHSSMNGMQCLLVYPKGKPDKIIPAYFDLNHGIEIYNGLFILWTLFLLPIWYIFKELITPKNLPN